MWLASVDGVITPVEEARIPVADDGLLRGDGAFEVMRIYGGRPFALDDHFARLGRTCAGLRLESDLDALRGEALALVERAAEPESLLRLVVTRGGRRIALAEPLPSRPATARVATVTYAPTRVLNGLKTLSYAGNMLAGRLASGAGLRRGALRHAARARARGPDVDVLLGARRAPAHAAADGRDPRLDHARTAAGGARRDRGAVHARRRARGRGGVHRLIGARGDADRRGRRDRAAARSRARHDARPTRRSGGASPASSRLRPLPRKRGAHRARRPSASSGTRTGAGRRRRRRVPCRGPARRA